MPNDKTTPPQAPGSKGRGSADAAGQQKSYTVTNPTTGESKTVTQREWREQQLGRAGFEKPAELDDTVVPPAPPAPDTPQVPIPEQPPSEVPATGSNPNVKS